MTAARRIALALLPAWLAPVPASALVCGESVASTIDVLGEVDSYAFQAAAGDVISVSVGGPFQLSSFGVVAVLRNPNNQIVSFRNIYDQGAQSPFCGAHLTCETSAPLALSGTYTLQVSDFQNNATGPYSLTLDTVGGTWNGGSNAPPVPVCGAVTDGTSTIACGQTVSDELEVHADADTWTFLAAAGDVLSLSVARPEVGTLNPVAELFAPGGARVDFDLATGWCQSDSCESDPLPATGVYTIKLTDSSLTHTGPYSLTLETVAESFDGASNGPPSPTCGVPSDGTRTIACGETLAGSIDVAGDSDTFVFHADAGEGVALRLRPTGGAPASLLPRVTLFGPDAARLLDAAGPPYPQGPLSSGPLPDSGVYTLKVSDDPNSGIGATGPYELTLVSGGLDGNGCRSGPALRCGETVSGSIAVGEMDAFSFPARAGDAVRLRTDGNAVAAPLLLAPDGTLASTTAPLAQTGVYTVALSARAGGSYQLTLEAVSGSLNGGGNGWPPLACGNAIPDGTRSIACGQTPSGSLDVGADTDTYSFLAAAGDQVTVRVTDAFARGALFAPGGAPVALGGEPDCGPNETCVSGPVPASGAYTILVSQPNGIVTGAYTIQMNRSPCASACQDGIDNDGDTLTDFPNDTGCTSADDLSEAPECSDGFDNDGDGLTDFAGGDLGCASWDASVEDPFCDDGLDNDLDGAIDADGGGAGSADSLCAGLHRRTAEAPSAGFGCGIGPELAVLLPLLAGVLRIRRGRGR